MRRAQQGKSGRKAEGRAEICETSCVDHDKVSSVARAMNPEEVVQRIAETFRVLGDPTRTKIVHALSIAELCVCDIATLLNTTRSAVSHQLRILRTMRLVTYRKEGKMVFYSLDDEHINNLFNECLRHVKEDE
ncbi:MAG: metalloregulator ArsR/SmtB family transcription factor [Nitrospirota bacterium]